MKSSKQRQKEYEEKYGQIPCDYNERLEWMDDHYKLNDSMRDQIINRMHNMMNNIEFYDFLIVLNMAPEGTPRHRYRLITPKNYIGAAMNNPYVQVYQPRAADKHNYFKKLVDSEIIQLERFIQTPFACNIVSYFPMPSNYNRSDVFVAECGLDVHIKKPDVDNLMKSYLDMFNATVWLDDNMCFSGALTKLYSVKPRVEIYIRYANCAFNKYQYDHITSRVGYENDGSLYYLDKFGNPVGGVS